MTGEFDRVVDTKEAVFEARTVFGNVQCIPYVLGLDGDPNKLLTENKGNCTRKHLYLAGKLLSLGYKVSLGVAVFDWRELPIPRDITALLKDSTDTHLFLYVSRGGNESVVDATWDREMPEGFIKNDWDGENSTPISVPAQKLWRQDLIMFQTKITVSKPLRIARNLLVKNKPTPFNDAFNQWIGRNK